ncbi:MAG: hypothetical protein ACRD4G_00100 [Bryobacteraceae bacterium]
MSFRTARQHLVGRALFLIAAALIGIASCQHLAAQITFGPLIFMGTTEKLANTASPTLITFNGQLYLFYVNSSNSTIYVDVGLTGRPASTGLVVYSGGLSDVGAAVLDGNNILLTYIAPNQVPMAALTPNGTTITSNVAINTASTGFNSLFVPTPVAVGPDVFLSIVGNGNYVYLYETFNGTSFGYLHQESGYSTISRPAMADGPSGLWIGFTTQTSGGRQAIVGPDQALKLVPGYYCGQNTHDGAYAGLGLLEYGGAVYAFSQNTLTVQDAQYVFTNNGGASWSGLYEPGNQMRWTPSLTLDGGTVFFIYQDDDNTNMTYRTGT